MCVVVVLFTLLLAGLAKGEETSVCQVVLKENETMHSNIIGMAFQCILGDDSLHEQLDAAVTQEEYHTLFQGYCEKRSTYQTCLNDVALQSQACQNTTRHKAFGILKHLLETILDTGCKDNGAALSSLSFGYYSFMEEMERDRDLRKCVLNSISRTKLVSTDDRFEASAKIFVLYNEALNMRDCFRDYGKGASTFTSTSDTFLNEIIETMKCIHPEDNTTVLCKSIDRSGYCPIRSDEERPQSMTDIVVEDLVMCIKRNNTSVDGFDDIEDLEGYRAFFKKFCPKYNDAEKCMNQAMVLSGLCLNRAGDEMFRLRGDFVLSSLESGCLAQGEPLAIIAYNLVRDDNGTEGHPNPMGECLQAVNEALENTLEEDIHAKTRVLHKELGSFKHCFDGKLRGDNMAIFHVDLMFNGMLRKMTCVDPESNASLPCETLQPTPVLQNCPFVPEGEDDHPSYSMFNDLAMSCLAASRQDLRQLEKFSELHEYEQLFETYCADKTLVANCLKDVAAYSKVCSPAIEYQMLQIHTDVWSDAVKTGCAGDGGKLATTVYAMNKYKEPLAPCKTAAGGRFDKLSKEGVNTTTIAMETYSILNEYTECYSTSIPDDGEFKTYSISFLRELLKRLQCVNDDGATVPCENIVNAVLHN